MAINKVKNVMSCSEKQKMMTFVKNSKRYMKMHDNTVKKRIRLGLAPFRIPFNTNEIINMREKKSNCNIFKIP